MEDQVISGWASGPNTRGTSDLPWPSFLTIFLCTWTAICLNIPHPKESRFCVFRRRLKWMFWAIVGPEIVLSVAIGQYASARRSVTRFKRLGVDWSVRHGFFADMGGIILRIEGSPPFVVNSRQLAYLVEKQYVACPTITSAEIWDKSKADTLSKTLTLIQASWLLVQLVGRAVLGLPITTLELSAGAIVFCTFGTFLCWLHKASDIQHGIFIDAEVSISKILVDAGEKAEKPYQHTPLDFIAKVPFTCSYDIMKIVNLRCDDHERPLRQFPNDQFPNIGTWEKFALFCMSSAYAALHFIPWNFEFPSRTELIIWRVSASVFTGVTVFFWIFETIAARHRYGRWDKYLRWMRLKEPEENLTDTAEIKGMVRQSTVERLDSFETEQHKAKPIAFWEIGLLSPIVLCYVIARAYMIVEVFVSLRRLPVGVYHSFELSELIPHF